MSETKTTTETTAVSQDVVRRNVIREMLANSTARNPTSILGTVLSDFKAQGKTELSVYQGEEIFILYEINDWAFVTAISDSRRRGYVPLDYCDLVKDFYSFNPAVSTWQVVEYKKPVEKKATSKPRARRVLFADEVQGHRAKNGYSTQSLPRDWGKTREPPKPQVRWRNGFFYLESPSLQDKNSAQVKQHPDSSKQPDPRLKYNSLPNMRNVEISHVPRKARNAFYSINETAEQGEKQKLRLASAQLYGSLSNRLDQQRRPIARSSSLNQLRDQPVVQSTTVRTANAGPSILRVSQKTHNNQWQSLETLHEANEADESLPGTVLPGRRSSAKDSERGQEPKRSSLRRSSSLNTQYPRDNNNSEKEKIIERLVKRFQQKLLEADSLGIPTQKPQQNNGKELSIPELKIIPATPETIPATPETILDTPETILATSETTATIPKANPSTPEANSVIRETNRALPKTSTASPTVTEVDHTSNEATQKPDLQRREQKIKDSTISPIQDDRPTGDTKNSTKPIAQPNKLESLETKETTANAESDLKMIPTRIQEENIITSTNELENRTNMGPTVTSHSTHSTCCCCHHHHHHGHHQSPASYIDGGNYLHVLQYISTPPPPTLNSPVNDHHSESGLGDTESIHSAGELQRQTSHTDSATETQRQNYSDGATQTTGSLEDLKAAESVETFIQVSSDNEVTVSPFQRSSKMRQSQKPSVNPTVTPQIEEPEADNHQLEQNGDKHPKSRWHAEQTSRLKERVDNSKSLDYTPSTSRKDNKLSEEEYNKLQVSSVEEGFGKRRYCSDGKQRGENSQTQRVDGTQTQNDSEHETYQSTLMKKPGNIKSRQPERRLSLPSGAKYPTFDQLTRTQSFSTSKSRQTVTNGREEGVTKLNYTTLNDLTALEPEGESDLKAKKKSWRSEFYDKHDATLAEINHNHEDPWGKRNNEKQKKLTKRNSPIQRRQNTLNNIREQYMKLEETRKGNESLTDGNSNIPASKKRSPDVRQNSIHRWLDSIDLKETDFDAAGEVIESDNEEIII